MFCSALSVAQHLTEEMVLTSNSQDVVFACRRE